jgi:hypothetical protein
MSDWKPGDVIRGPNGGRVQAPEYPEEPLEWNLRSVPEAAVTLVIVFLLTVGLVAVCSPSGSNEVTAKEEKLWYDVKRPVTLAYIEYRRAVDGGEPGAPERIATAIQPNCEHAFGLPEPTTKRALMWRRDTLEACSAMKLG